MREMSRKTVAVFLALMLCAGPDLGMDTRALGFSSEEDRQPSLPMALQKSYAELFEVAASLQFTPAEVATERKALKAGEQTCRSRFAGSASRYQKQLDVERRNLRAKGLGLDSESRHAMHCSIQNLELLRSEAEVLAKQAIPNAYDNLNAKLTLITEWPAQRRTALAELASGSYAQRRWSDVKDIGFREIASGQESDVKRGKQAVDELKAAGLLPPELENPAIQKYVRSVADRVAMRSDLKIPLHVSVLQSREVNAFALPGGYLFIERGLLEQVEDEAQLAGVIAHEIAHDTARHSAKLMKRATISSLFYQAAQVAAVILTGGAAGIGLYYALQYGYYGLGLVLDLKLLGISRDYELEADQLGVQYAWNAGYDTSGFIRFFDKMATREGYINGVSWFRTHPPFYDRMLAAQREILFMPKKTNLTVNTAEFEQMKKLLTPIAAEAEKEEAGKPSLLLSKEQGCAPPQKLEYKSGQPIEQLCSAPEPRVQTSQP